MRHRLSIALSAGLGIGLLAIVLSGSATSSTPLNPSAARALTAGPLVTPHVHTAAIDLLTQANVRIDGAGERVTSAGDVNGDGRRDLILGVSDAHNSSGAAYVIFGQKGVTRIDLRHLGERGYRINGAARGDQAGFSVANGGDMNGDGRPDVLLGAIGTCANDGQEPGSAYVVFGQASTATINLAQLGAKGYRINGVGGCDSVGWSVAGAGDLNGDGRSDVLLGAVSAANSRNEGSGAVYAVFGQAGTATIDLAQLGARGFRIEGAAAGDDAGWSVAGAGDVNGDGRTDLALGALLASNSRGERSGAAYVVFGQAGTATIDLAHLGTDGYRVDGAHGGRSSDEADSAGFSVASAGDVDGDGRPDLLLGAPDADNNGRKDSGSAYIVFGQADTTTIDLAHLGAKGRRIDGAASGDEAGFSVASAGDVNGDGRPDLLLGAENASNNGRDRSGSAYVVFGQADMTAIDLRYLGARGYRIDGTADRDFAGFSVASAGDVNGDGRPDLLLGAFGASYNHGYNRPGATFVVFSPSLVVGTPGSDKLNGSSGTDLIFGLGGGDTIRGAGGNDVIDGGPGSDRIIGGAGNDRLEGGPGRDKLFGGAGLDTILARDRTRDEVDGGRGRDRARIDRGRDWVRKIELFF